MAGTSSLPSGAPWPTDSASVLQRIETNTAETVRWMKILVAVMIVLIVVTGLLFV